MIALLSNVTVESLALRLKKNIEVFTAPGFDSWRAEMLNPSSALWRDEIKMVYVLLHGPALFPDGPDSRFAEILSEPLRIISQARAGHGEKIFVVSTLDLPAPSALTACPKRSGGLLAGAGPVFHCRQTRGEQHGSQGNSADPTDCSRSETQNERSLPDSSSSRRDKPGSSPRTRPGD